MKIRFAMPLIAAVIVAGCTAMQGTEKSMPVDQAAPRDGDLALPTAYASWPVFIAGVDKENNQQVRDIYINTQGANMQKGDAFPPGTQLVMALYAAQQNADGNLQKSASGKLVKGDLSKVFIMEKRPGWGDSTPAGLQNGDWVYAAYNADGSKADVDYSACRSCHLPLSDTDYVFHYDHYFGT